MVLEEVEYLSRQCKTEDGEEQQWTMAYKGDKYLKDINKEEHKHERRSVNLDSDEDVSSESEDETNLLENMVVGK